MFLFALVLCYYYYFLFINQPLKCSLFVMFFIKYIYVLRVRHMRLRHQEVKYALIPMFTKI